VTTRRSEDLPPPLPANVRQFPLIIGPEVVIGIALRQRDRATGKAIARHRRRKGRRRKDRARAYRKVEEAGV
jgi:hypothetical protein